MGLSFGVRVRVVTAWEYSEMSSSVSPTPSLTQVEFFSLPSVTLASFTTYYLITLIATVVLTPLTLTLIVILILNP